LHDIIVTAQILSERNGDIPNPMADRSANPANPVA
jgi:hypothetical protein